MNKRVTASRSYKKNFFLLHLYCEMRYKKKAEERYEKMKIMLRERQV